MQSTWKWTQIIKIITIYDHSMEGKMFTAINVKFSVMLLISFFSWCCLAISQPTIKRFEETQCVHIQLIWFRWAEIFFNWRLYLSEKWIWDWPWSVNVLSHPSSRTARLPAANFPTGILLLIILLFLLHFSFSTSPFSLVTL